MKKFLTGMTVMFIVILLISTGAFAYLFFSQSTKAGVLELQVESLQNTLASLESEEGDTSPESNTTKFVDIGMEINLEYPLSWTMELNTQSTDDFVYEPIYGRVIEKYELILVKNATELKFTKILGAVDGFPAGFNDSEMDYIDLGNNLMRISENGANEWSYVQKLACSDYTGEPFDMSEYDICYANFFPGFGKYANYAGINSSDLTLLSEADNIVLSALNN